jgi:DinB superfamily
MRYTALSLSELVTEFGVMARDTQAVFGALSEHQLNWRPDETRWSVAQCFDHLLAANTRMFQSLDAAMQGHSQTIWQRMPILPRLYGAMLIKSQAPEAKRRFTAPARARPSTSAIDAGIIQRFVAYQHEAAERVRSLQGRDVARTIMVSPFVSFVTYSVLDGCRLIATHQRRHFEQARRVMQEPGFPTAAL